MADQKTRVTFIGGERLDVEGSPDNAAAALFPRPGSGSIVNPPPGAVRLKQVSDGATYWTNSANVLHVAERPERQHDRAARSF